MLCWLISIPQNHLQLTEDPDSTPRNSKDFTRERRQKDLEKYSGKLRTPADAMPKRFDHVWLLVLRLAIPSLISLACLMYNEWGRCWSFDFCCLMTLCLLQASKLPNVLFRSGYSKRNWVLSHHANYHQGAYQIQPDKNYPGEEVNQAAA